MHKSCDNKGCIFGFQGIAGRKAVCTELLGHFFGQKTVVTACLRVFPGWSFLGGPDHLQDIFFGNGMPCTVFTDTSSFLINFEIPYRFLLWVYK